MNAFELLFLLLPVAALSGWIIGRKNQRKALSRECDAFSSDYFKGVNYLLNEQSDKALEVFIQMSELDNETIELHFTLANLFLRRGEVERAIRIHQNLIARPLLPQTEKSRALYELGNDYMRAGLLDRAENIFTELVDDPGFGLTSRQQLLDIYQQEKEWQKAIDVARKVSIEKGEKLSHQLAHFFCEQAELVLQQGDITQAQRMIKRAFNEQRDSVRATLLEARVHQLNNNPKAAIKSLKRIEETNREYLPLLLSPLQHAYEKLDKREAFLQHLRSLANGDSLILTLGLAEQLRADGDESGASELLRKTLHQSPSIRLLKKLVELEAGDVKATSQFEPYLSTLNSLLKDKPTYHCEHCGFSSRSMHWQCPGCRQWDSVKPIHGIEGD